MYMGALVCMLACAPSSCGRGSTRRSAALWAIVALIAIHLCAGDNGKILRFSSSTCRLRRCASPGVQARRGVADRGGRGVWRRRARGGGGRVRSARSAWRWRWSRSRSRWSTIGPEVNPRARCGRSQLRSRQRRSSAAIVFAPEPVEGHGRRAIALCRASSTPWFSYTDKVLARPARETSPARRRDLLSAALGVKRSLALYDEFLLGERVACDKRVRDSAAIRRSDPRASCATVACVEVARQEPRGPLPNSTSHVAERRCTGAHADQLSSWMPKPTR